MVRGCKCNADKTKNYVINTLFKHSENIYPAYLLKKSFLIQYHTIAHLLTGS